MIIDVRFRLCKMGSNRGTPYPFRCTMADWPVEDKGPIGWTFLQLLQTEVTPSCCRPMRPWMPGEHMTFLEQYAHDVFSFIRRQGGDGTYAVWVTCQCDHGVQWDACVKGVPC